MKGAMEIGEAAVFAHFPNVEFKPMGEGFTRDTQDRARDIAVAGEAWEEVKRMLAEVLTAIDAKPTMTHFVITGRNASDAVKDAADLVTKMELVKHPFRERKIKAQRGIEF